MLISILVSALLVSCPVLAIITLPNGFQFDETKYLQPNSRASTAVEECHGPFGGCSNDCSAQLNCNEWGKAIYRMECFSMMPYCVKNTSLNPMCSSIFPMEGACLTKATNTFVCSEDGVYPDLTDCTKYHVCSGTEHHIESCQANEQFTFDQLDPGLDQDPMVRGNGEYKCRFIGGSMGSCGMCDKFYCDGMANQFTFRMLDFFHYAYCIELGPLKRAIMFKCPPGTRHYGYTNATTNAVDCVPIGSIP